ncbi:MAG: peptidoglycan DD-metalloendopeptidase family protein [bacterium]|nr:peptidoglycan DD-metalloendopeptidase family protein [bacterium]
MKKQTIIIMIFSIVMSFLSIANYADHIANDRGRWKPLYRDLTPGETVKEWKVPFKTIDRKDVKTIGVVSTFAAKRLSYIRGHFHTGLDMVPKKRRERSAFIYVYPIAPGVVCSIHLGAPHTTVVVKHKLPNGKTIFSSYKHLGERYVETGQQLTADSRIGRLYTRAEAKKLGGNYHHLHMEIRKSFDDYGVASWATMTREDLNLRFHDPLKFMKENVSK